MKTIKYNGFIGSVEVSIEDNCIHGKILFINDLITYESDTPNNLQAKFEEAVDDYIETCTQLNIEPLKSFGGSFNVRIEPEKHQELALLAAQNDTTINKIVKKAIGNYINKPLKGSEIHNHHTFNIVVEKSYDDLIPESIASKKAIDDIIKFDTIPKSRVN